MLYHQGWEGAEQGFQEVHVIKQFPIGQWLIYILLLRRTNHRCAISPLSEHYQNNP